MKTNLNRSLMLTAVAVTLGVAAYGQNNITATVPFSFKANGTAQKAGDYSVVANAGATVLHLVNKSTGQSVQLGIGTPEGAAAGEPRPRLVFHCGDDGGCALAEVWIGDGRGWSYKHALAKGPKYETAVAVYYGAEVSK